MLFQHERDHISSQGFVLMEGRVGTITTLTLKVNATTEKNGTEMLCSSSYSVESDTALLLVINGEIMLLLLMV